MDVSSIAPLSRIKRRSNSPDGHNRAHLPGVVKRRVAGNSDGTNHILIGVVGDGVAGSPHWTPDGQFVVFDASSNETGSDVGIGPAAGGHLDESPRRRELASSVCFARWPVGGRCVRRQCGKVPHCRGQRPPNQDTGSPFAGECDGDGWTSVGTMEYGSAGCRRDGGALSGRMLLCKHGYLAPKNWTYLRWTWAGPPLVASNLQTRQDSVFSRASLFSGPLRRDSA